MGEERERSEWGRREREVSGGGEREVSGGGEKWAGEEEGKDIYTKANDRVTTHL